MPRAIWAAGPRSAGAGSASVTGAPASAAATAPSGSKDTTTTGVAPPDQATSAIRRTGGEAVGVGERGLGGDGGEDHGGDGHGGDGRPGADLGPDGRFRATMAVPTP